VDAAFGAIKPERLRVQGELGMRRSWTPSIVPKGSRNLNPSVSVEPKLNWVLGHGDATASELDTSHRIKSRPSDRGRDTSQPS
jgi:hypothetical protein